MTESSIANRKSQIASVEPAQRDNLLQRPPEQRLREYKYRFSQSVVFGLPVVALQVYGRALGPADSERWVSLLQALLAGWVLYVNLGMLFEGILLLPARRVTGDFVVSIVAAALYAYSLVSAAHGVVTSRLLFRPLLFHVVIMVLAAWTGWRWRQMARVSATAEPREPRATPAPSPAPADPVSPPPHG